MTVVANTPRGPLRVAIIARLPPGEGGGVEQAIMGTVAALGKLTDGNEQYVVVTDPATPPWLERYAGPNTRIVSPETPQWRRYARRVLRPVLPFIEDVTHRRATARQDIDPPNAFVESLRPDVVHFPYQQLHRTTAPSIFNPQDIQHVHRPEFFDAATLAYRRRMYPLWCGAATKVEVPSSASKEDLVRHLGVSSEKVLVIRKAAPTTLAEPVDASMLSRCRAEYHLPDAFLLFPAQTWQHKNHIRLFEALAQLRDEHDVRLPLVCTGRQNTFWPVLRAKLAELRLTEQVRFLGFIPADDVRALYHLAEVTVFPTLFEGGGFPLLEAFQEGSPLACSNLPVLTAQAGDAALYFDPTSREDIARALRRLHNDPALRDQLRERGKARAGRYSWNHTARTYRALYRMLASRALTGEDTLLLQEASDGRTPTTGPTASGEAVEWARKGMLADGL
jgi:glycosyltransferase involved in cell wall biosynthesis